jgi:hypothetical protein
MIGNVSFTPRRATALDEVREWQIFRQAPKAARPELP